MLKMYPRGFVGPILENKDNGQPELQQELSMANNTYRLDTTIKKMEVVPDRVIQELFESYRRDESLLFKFDFRERLLKRAKTLFSLGNQTVVFKGFIEAQFSSSKLSYIHVEILKEILDFITTGKIGFKAVTWERMLEKPSQLRYVPDDKKKEIYLSLIETYKTTTINDTIVKWVNQENGYANMMRVLWLLFGSLDIDHE